MQNRLNFKDNFLDEMEDIYLYQKIKDERDSIGYYNLPYQDIENIKSFNKDIDDSKNEYRNIVVIGIGGSSLGTKAIYHFLKVNRILKRRIHFFESTDPIMINYNLSKIDINKSLFIVISKSGNTVETISTFKLLLSRFNIKDMIPEDKREQFIVITDSGSNLEKFAILNQLKLFNLPKNVGGRFSVLSVVGLVPLSLSGINIQKLLNGAKSIDKDFLNKNSDIYKSLISKASFYAKNSDKYNINCIFSYSESLRYFNEWYIQLWGESLGKKQRNSLLHTGLTPIGLIGPTDQHSFLQLIIDGKRDKSVTFIKVKDFIIDLKIPDIKLKYMESLDNINNLQFSKLINMQADSIIESLESKNDIPLDIIELSRMDADNIGKLIFYYEILTSLVATMLNIDAYNQPGVEDGKLILKDRLNKE